MSKLAPVRIGGLIMGVWFLGASVGNYIGGRMAGFYESMTLPSLFGAVAAFGVACGLLLLALSRPMRRLEEGRAAAATVIGAGPDPRSTARPEQPLG